MVLRRPSRQFSNLPLYSTVEEAFGAVLREARLERGLKQFDLAALSTVAQSFISQLETGQRQVCLRNLMQLALALEMQPEELTRRASERLDPRAKRKLIEESR